MKRNRDTAIKASTIGKKLTIEYVKEKIEETGDKLLSTEYVNSWSLINVQCKCGIIYTLTWNDFQQGARCAICSHKEGAVKRRNHIRKTMDGVLYKKCGICKEYKVKEEYNYDEKTCDQWSVLCKKCKTDYTNDWVKENPNRRKDIHLKSLLNKKYKIQREFYDDLLEKQGGKCSICGATNTVCKRYSRLVVDHNHKTGRIRGLLCMKCNTLLGNAQDSIETLKNAIKYLQENSDGKEG